MLDRVLINRRTCQCGWHVYPIAGEAVKCGACGRMVNAKLGDHIERLLSYVGGRQFKAWYKRLTGKDCGCDKRKRWINRASQRIYRAWYRMLSN